MRWRASAPNHWNSQAATGGHQYRCLTVAFLPVLLMFQFVNLIVFIYCIYCKFRMRLPSEGFEKQPSRIIRVYIVYIYVYIMCIYIYSIPSLAPRALLLVSGCCYSKQGPIAIPQKRAKATELVFMTFAIVYCMLKHVYTSLIVIIYQLIVFVIAFSCFRFYKPVLLIEFCDHGLGGDFHARTLSGWAGVLLLCL